MNHTQPPQTTTQKRRKPKGFALILSLTLMSFMVILVLSLATFLNVEMQTASHQSRMDEARANAILGAQIALGQLQIYAGPDQAATAPATVAYPEKTSPGKGEMWDIYRSHATGLPHSTEGVLPSWSTFLKEDYNNSLDTDRDSWEEELDLWWAGDSPETKRHPRWLGVWDSSTRVTNAEASSSPNLRAGDFNRDQTPRWLVSGNETRTSNSQFTPDKRFDGADDPVLVKLVGYGSAAPATSANPEDRSSDGMDGAVYAPKVNINDANGSITGQYAYWVTDENMKANFSILDPYFENDDPASRDYRNRLQVPQRLGWEQIEGFDEIYESYSDEDKKKMINSPVMEKIETTSQIALIDMEKGDKYLKASRKNFHHITGYSKGLFTDQARGGLKHDLSVFLQGGNTEGLLDASNPIPDPDGTDVFGYALDQRFGPNNNGFPASDQNIPTWQDILEWYQNEAQGAGEGSIDATVDTGPVITQLRMFAGLSYEGDDLRLNILPQVVLWNPWDAGLKTAKYEIVMKFNPKFNNFRLATDYDNSGTLIDKNNLAYNPALYEGNGGPLEHRWRYYMVADKDLEQQTSNLPPIALERDHLDGDNDWARLLPFYFNDLKPLSTPGTSLKKKGIPDMTDIDNGLELAANHPNLSPALSLAEVRRIFIDTDSEGNPPAPLPPYPTLETGLDQSVYDIEIMQDEESELVLQIDTSFGAGEGLMFTVAEDQKISMSQGGDVATIILRNEYASENPASAYINIAQIESPDPAEFVAPVAEINVNYERYFFTDYAQILPRGFKFDFYIGGELYQSFDQLGNVPTNITVNATGTRNTFTQIDQPMVWRRVHKSDKFSGEIEANRDTNLRVADGKHINNSIFGVGEAYIEPTYFRGTSPIDKEAAGTTFRPFANYNVMARNYTNNNPIVDEIRHQNDWGNRNGGDGFTQFNSVISRANTNSNQPPINDFFNPSDNIAWNKQMSGSGGVIADGDTSNGSRAIHDVGFPWNSSNSGDLRAQPDPKTGRIQSYSLIEFVKLRSGLTRKTNTAPLIESLGIMPVRLTRRPTSNIVSLGQLQQVNLSPFLWQPANPIGNSEASAYVDRQYITGISRPMWQYYRTNPDGTVYKDSNENYVKDARWRAGIPNNVHNHMVDMSYLLNDALWDRYFISTFPQSGDVELDNSATRLANSRIRFETANTEDLDDYRDFDEAAAHFYNEGAFNVNSTSVEAWKALLTAFRDLQLKSQNGEDPNPEDSVPVSRTLDPLTGPIDFTFGLDLAPDPKTYGADPSEYMNLEKFFGGYRYLSDAMIQTLAERIVDEVRLRGPFYSMSDFVNRRLVAPDGAENNSSPWIASRTGGAMVDDSYDSLVGLTGINGTLQRALNVSGINGGVNYPRNTSQQDNWRKYDAIYFPLNYSNAHTKSWGSEWRWFYVPSIKEYLDSENRAGAPIGEQGPLLSHAPGFVTQADLLSMLGPVLTARGDTFVIRSYGSSINKLTGEIQAEAWLELTVQRITRPVNDLDQDFVPDEFDPDPDADPDTIQLGRKFEIVDFRWLSQEDV